MTIGRPGIVVITDDAGTWTAGDVVVTIYGDDGNGTDYTQGFSSNKDTSMTALAAKIAAHGDVLSAVYSNSAHTITVTPVLNKQIDAEIDVTGRTGTMTATVETTPEHLGWGTDEDTCLAPSSGEAAAGMADEDRLPARWFNWALNNIYKWIRWAVPKIDYILSLISTFALESEIDAIEGSGNFEATFPNGNGGVKVKIYYQKYKSGLVKWWWDDLTGMTSDTNHSAVGTPIPEAIRPSAVRTMACNVAVSSTSNYWMNIPTDGSLTINGAANFTVLNSGVAEYLI